MTNVLEQNIMPQVDVREAADRRIFYIEPSYNYPGIHSDALNLLLAAQGSLRRHAVALKNDSLPPVDRHVLALVEFNAFRTFMNRALLVEPSPAIPEGEHMVGKHLYRRDEEGIRVYGNDLYSGQPDFRLLVAGRIASHSVQAPKQAWVDLLDDVMHDIAFIKD